MFFYEKTVLDKVRFFMKKIDKVMFFFYEKTVLDKVRFCLTKKQTERQPDRLGPSKGYIGPFKGNIKEYKGMCDS